MKVIIAGSRGITNYSIILKAIRDSGFEDRLTEVVSGGARGCDQLGERYGEENGIPIEYFPADWNDLSHPDAVIKKGAYGKYNAIAGHLRNQEMADYADAAIIIVKNKSSGSMDMNRRMCKQNKPVYLKHITLKRKKL